MGLESTTTIGGLVSTNPVASDAVGQADDHLRLVKTVLKTIFPGAGGVGFVTPLTATEVELNYVDGVTSAIQTQLNTIGGNATTALANAATADGKAVTADGKAVTADGKAVAAQSTANTALANAATADGKAVSAQSTANTALANAATADGKAVTAQAMGADAWALFTNAGILSKGYNIASISKIATGKYEVTFTSAMPNTTYVVLCNTSIQYIASTILATDKIRLETFTDFTATTYSNSAYIQFAVFAVA